MKGKLNIKSVGFGNEEVAEIHEHFEVHGLGASVVGKTTKVRGGVAQTGQF
jgi:hypothetical protein